MVVQLSIPEVVLRGLKKKADEKGVSLSDYLLEIAVGNLDPSVAFRSCIEGAVDLIGQARLELEKGDLRQASEKLWGACTLAIKAHCLRRKGKRIESRVELWTYKNEVARELGLEQPLGRQTPWIRTSTRTWR